MIQYKKRMDKTKRVFNKVLAELKKRGALRVCKSDITTFFVSSSRSENDAINKKRENVLAALLTAPAEYFTDIEFGERWRMVRMEWIKALPPGPVSTKLMGGRKYNYDIELKCDNGDIRKLEFKYGGTNISELPQFLSLQAKTPLFSHTFPQFYYEKYIDLYIGCDPGITESKPPLAQYLDQVTKLNYDVNPFFAQLKDRELVAQDRKNKIVNDGITDYLTTHGHMIDLVAFAEKVKATQQDKIYMLWTDGKFHVDSFDLTMNRYVFRGIRNGNILEVQTGNMIFSMLLRWRNHKGILNPAWQISLKRI